jgi:hypothetical protein
MSRVIQEDHHAQAPNVPVLASSPAAATKPFRRGRRDSSGNELSDQEVNKALKWNG